MAVDLRSSNEKFYLWKWVSYSNTQILVQASVQCIRVIAIKVAMEKTYVETQLFMILSQTDRVYIDTYI